MIHKWPVLSYAQRCPVIAPVSWCAQDNSMEKSQYTAAEYVFYNSMHRRNLLDIYCVPLFS